MNLKRLLRNLGAIALAGCASAGGNYASQHPELSETQRTILKSGRVPTGTAIAGLTHEQVKLAMGGFPETFDRVNGEEAWVYTRKKSVAKQFNEDRDRSSGSSYNRPDSYSASDNAGPGVDVNVRTTIYFQGDRATHAENREETPAS